MGFFDWFSPHNDFQAKPVVNSYQATAMGGVNGADQSLGNAQQNYGQQGDFINMLQGQAMGQGPSVAQEMLKQQTWQAQQNAASAVASQRGMNPGLAAKMIMDQQAQQGQMAAGQGSLMRAQEMMSARGMLGSALGQQAQSNLGAGNLALGQQGQQLGNYWNAQGINANVAGQNANLAQQAQSLNADVAHQNAGTGAGLLGGLASGLSGGLIKFGSGGAGAAGAAAPPPDVVPMAHGGDVDDPKNDTVHALLSPHEIVLPRSVTLAEDAPERARDFVRAIKGRLPQHRQAPWKMDAGGEVPGKIAAGKGEQVKLHESGKPPKDSPDALRRVLMNQAQPQKMAEGGYPNPDAHENPMEPPPDASFPAEDATPASAAYTAGGTALTAPGAPGPADVPASQGVPEMLARPPDISPSPRAAADTSIAVKPPSSAGEVSNMRAGEKQEAGAIGKEAEAAQGFSKNQTQIMDSWNAARQELNSNYQAAMKDHLQKSDALFADVMKSGVQPNRYWEQMSTAGKITSSIGMILGGIGSGLTGQPNVAMAMIDKAIDRDVEAQKLNINKKQNLLSKYMEMGHDMQQSHLMASADMHDAAAAQLARASAAYQGTKAAADAQLQIGQLRQNAAEKRLQATSLDFGNQEKALNMQYMRWTMSAKSALTSGGGQQVNPEFLDKDTRERVVDVPNVGQRLAPTGKDAEEVKKVMEAKEEFQATIDRMRAFRKLHSGGTWLPAGMEPATATGKALHAEAITHMNKIADLARFTPEEHQQFEEQISRPDKFKMSDASFNAQLDELQRMLDARLTSSMRNRLEGAKPAMPPITRSAGQ